MLTAASCDQIPTSPKVDDAVIFEIRNRGCDRPLAIDTRLDHMNRIISLAARVIAGYRTVELQCVTHYAVILGRSACSESEGRETMPSFNDLFAPNEEYEYFALAREYAFDAQDKYFSLVNAGWLADCSLLVYLTNETDVTNRLVRDGGFSDVTCIGFERPGAQCFVARRDEGTVVCFRGTEVSEWQDLVADADLILAPNEGSDQGASVHRGFLRSLDTVWGEVENALDGGNVWFTGHSLGAALATLAADRLAGSHPLYTFGSPRVGDKKFRQAFRPNAYRFVNNNDGVTVVPPGSNIFPYRHVGDLKYLDAEGRLIDDARWWQRFKAGLSGQLKKLVEVEGEFRKGDFDTVPLDQLADHSPTSYAKNVWRNVNGNR